MNSQEISSLCNQFADMKREGDHQPLPSSISCALHRPLTVKVFYGVERAMIPLRSSVLGQVIAKVIECVSFATLLPIFIVETTLSAGCNLILVSANALSGKRLQASKARGEAYFRSTLATMRIAGIALFRWTYISSHTQAVLQEQKTYQQALLAADKTNQLFHAHLPVALQAIQKAFHNDLSSDNLIDRYQPTATIDEGLATDIAESKIQEGFIRLATFFKQVAEQSHENEDPIVVDEEDPQQNDEILSDHVEDGDGRENELMNSRENHNQSQHANNLENHSHHSGQQQYFNEGRPRGMWNDLFFLPNNEEQQLRQNQPQLHHANHDLQQNHGQNLMDSQSDSDDDDQYQYNFGRFEEFYGEHGNNIQQELRDQNINNHGQIVQQQHKIDLSNSAEWQRKIAQCTEQLERMGEQLAQLNQWNFIEGCWSPVMESLLGLQSELTEERVNTLIDSLKNLTEVVDDALKNTQAQFNAQSWASENQIYHFRQAGQVLCAMYQSLVPYGDVRRNKLNRLNFSNNGDRQLLSRHIQAANHYVSDRSDLWPHFDANSSAELEDAFNTLLKLESMAKLARLIEIEQCLCYPHLIAQTHLNPSQEKLKESCRIFSTLTLDEQERFKKWAIGDPILKEGDVPLEEYENYILDENKEDFKKLRHYIGGSSQKLWSNHVPQDVGHMFIFKA